MLKLKVLMIDDEIDYCRILENYFKKKNYEVRLAFNLTEGLQLIGSNKPDILFLDNNLPDGKGWAHVESIVEKNPHLKIYLVSAYFQQGDFFYDSPNVTVWEKPLSMNLLNAHF
jgi:two-component system OmpR family response regulator